MEKSLNEELPKPGQPPNKLISKEDSKFIFFSPIS